MSFVKVVFASLLIAVTGFTGVLFLHARDREAHAQELRQTVSDLQRHRQFLVARVRADVSAQRSTGLYQAQDQAEPGFRPMEFTTPGAKVPVRLIYVALVPDLGLEDIAAAQKQGDGLLMQLTPVGQARLRNFSRSRTTGGRAAREAIVIDGRIVAAPVFRSEIQTDTLVVAGLGAESSAWTQKLDAEIKAMLTR